MYKCLVALAALFVCGFGATAKADFVTIYNETGETIYHVYMSAPNNRNWEDDLLGNDVLPDGYHQRFRVNTNRGCYVDLKAVAAGGDKAERHNVDVCGGFDWTLY